MVGLARVGDGVQPGASSHLDPGLDPSRDTGGRERARVTTQVGLHTHTHIYKHTHTYTPIHIPWVLCLGCQRISSKLHDW